MVRTICPSLAMRMKALGVNAAAAAPTEGPVLKPMRSPPPSAALALRNCRRERSMVMSGPFLGRVLDSLADSHISTAAADVPRHRGVDVDIDAAGFAVDCQSLWHVSLLKGFPPVGLAWGLERSDANMPFQPHRFLERGLRPRPWR